MFGSLDMYSGRGSRKTCIASTAAGGITLDFGEGVQQRRRSSFLPESLTQEPEEHKVSTASIVFVDSSFFSPTRDAKKGKKTIKRFCTGSKYVGEWNMLGMAGKGIYKFPHGVVYDGHFNRNGEFHGSGILIYPGGQRIEGFWRNGKLMTKTGLVTDGRTVDDSYCSHLDRRFQIEIENELNPAGQEYLTNAPPPPLMIPEGCYDAGDGFYDPVIKATLFYSDLTVKPIDAYENFLDEDRLSRYNLLLKLSPSEEGNINSMRRTFVSEDRLIETIPFRAKENWIMKHCRRAWDEPTGYSPELYEVWTSCNRTTDITNSALRVLEVPEEPPFDQVSKTSTMFSFIQTFDGTKEMQLVRDKMGSLMALSTMFFLPKSIKTTKKQSIAKKLRAITKISKKFLGSNKNRPDGHRRGSLGKKHIIVKS